MIHLVLCLSLGAIGVNGNVSPDFFFDNLGFNKTMSVTKFGELLKRLKVGEEYRKINCQHMHKHSHVDHNHSVENYDYDDDHASGKFTNHHDQKETLKEHDKKIQGQCLHHTKYPGLKDKDIISREDFIEICPAIISQLDERICEKCPETEKKKENKRLWIWIYSICAISISSLASLVCAVLVPLLKRVFYNHLLNFLVALAVSCLTGDALMHLIPHAILDQHSHDNEHNHEGEDKHRKALYYGLLAVIGIYSFFVFERIISWLGEVRRRRKEVKQSKKVKNLSKDGRNGQSSVSERVGLTSNAKTCPLNEEEVVGFQNKVSFKDPKEIEQERQRLSSLSQHQETESHCANVVMSVHSKEVKRYADEMHQQVFHHCELSPNDADCSASHSHVVHQHQHKDGVTINCSVDKGKANELQKQIKPVAWMVLFGDGLHNFCDGIAIGTAFSISISGGMSTALAVFCHELPHEFGDFAVLLRAGMSVRQALGYNFLSSVTSFVGMVIGIMIGETVWTSYMLTFIAGTFLYISLAHMLPEMTSIYSRKGEKLAIHAILQNAGLLIGWTGMFIIAYFH